MARQVLLLVHAFCCSTVRLGIETDAMGAKADVHDAPARRAAAAE